MKQGSGDVKDDAMSINLYITMPCDAFIQLYHMDWITKVKSRGFNFFKPSAVYMATL